MVSARTSAFPSSIPPQNDVEEDVSFDSETPSISELRVALPMVAIVMADRSLGDRLARMCQEAGRIPVGEDSLAASAVILTDAQRGARESVARLRGTARSDAAIIVVLGAGTPAAESTAAYEAGALLCLRTPVDEHHLLSAIGSVIDLQNAKVQADDLTRQLDVQAHLASLGRVTAGFTHEVSNPLATVTTNFEFVRDDLDALLRARDLLAAAVRDGLSPETVQAARACIARSSPAEGLRAAAEDAASALDRIVALLATVRDLARGGFSSRIEEVDLAAAVRGVRGWATRELQGVDVQELVDEPVVARADPRLLGQILLNLVTNAANAARQLPSPRVRLHVYGSADRAVVSVRDNGPGVPADIRDRIFEPFFTTRRAQGGTGLGLALCRQYALQMQAQLTLWTAPGRGACFRVHMQRV